MQTSLHGLRAWPLARARLDRPLAQPSDVGMAHGPGTAVGDPIEFGAVAAVYGKGRAPPAARPAAEV
ncbi:hypothetical protein [Streptomyces sp. NPDC058308]|uniref:hypothetical protein n=1 Tax=Streptomyces sp. NPDC058308 TaxID=3346440 RepID=UPI0036E88E63